MVFVLPEEVTKNGRERIVPLNSAARMLVEQRRKSSEGYVFGLEGKKLSRMNNKAWIKARDEVGLTNVRVHDLRHTFGMRLRAQGVGLEDRQDLLGHYSGRMTTHYSRADIQRLIECVELLCSTHEKPELTLVKCA
jgi:integrase